LDAEGDFSFRDESGYIFVEGTKYILNPFDRFALELAFRIRDEKGGQIKTICVGPSRCEAALRECLMLGVNEAIHVISEISGMLDPHLGSFYISEVIKMDPYDLILCGRQSMDYEWGQTGIYIAERLGIPHISEVIDLQMKTSKLYCRKQLEDGMALIEAALPAAITVQKSDLDIRFPTLTGIMKGKGKVIKQLKMQSKLEPVIKCIRLMPPKQRPKRIFTPDSSLSPIDRIKMIMSAGIVKKSQSRVLEEAPKEAASKLFTLLKEEKVL
jgi:electron transfer flavoprotein beta subunit